VNLVRREPAAKWGLSRSLRASQTPSKPLSTIARRSIVRARRASEGTRYPNNGATPSLARRARKTLAPTTPGLRILRLRARRGCPGIVNNPSKPPAELVVSGRPVRRAAFLWSATEKEPSGKTCTQIASILGRRVPNRPSAATTLVAWASSPCPHGQDARATVCAPVATEDSQTTRAWSRWDRALVYR